MIEKDHIYQGDCLTLMQQIPDESISMILTDLPYVLENKVGEDDKPLCLMIGDASGKEGDFSDSDRKCAENFGIDYMDVEDFIRTEV